MAEMAGPLTPEQLHEFDERGFLAITVPRAALAAHGHARM
jgi:hypothetical protein